MVPKLILLFTARGQGKLSLKRLKCPTFLKKPRAGASLNSHFRAFSSCLVRPLLLRGARPAYLPEEPRGDHLPSGRSRPRPRRRRTRQAGDQRGRGRDRTNAGVPRPPVRLNRNFFDSRNLCIFVNSREVKKLLEVF